MVELGAHRAQGGGMNQRLPALLRPLLLLALSLAACGPAPPDPSAAPEVFVDQLVDNLRHIAADYQPQESELDPADPAGAAIWKPMVAEMRSLLEPHLGAELMVDWRLPPARGACVLAWFHLQAAKADFPPEIELLKIEQAASPRALLRVHCFDQDGIEEASYRVELRRRDGAWKLVRPPRPR